MQERYFTANDLSIYYRVEGEGDPVMLIHGFGEDGEIWNTTIEGLKSRYRLIVPDLPGSGKSKGNIENKSMEDFAGYIHQILEKENITSCAMIGHSMGGYITLAFAEKYPEILNKFGLFHSTAFADSDEKKEARKKNIEFISKHGSEKFLRQSVPNLFADEFKKLHPQEVESFISRHSNFSAQSLMFYTEAMMNRKDRIDVLKTFNKPVLFIMGEFDTAVPLEQGLRQCSIPEFSYIYVCAHSGHMGMMEEPEFCQKAIQEFLSGE